MKARSTCIAPLAVLALALLSGRGAAEPTPAPDAKARPAGPSSASELNDQVKAIKDAFDCGAPLSALYCAALGRFVSATPVAISTKGTWAGHAVQALLSRGKVAHAGVQFYALAIRGGKVLCSPIEPSDASEMEAMNAQLIRMRSGKAPPKNWAPMRFLEHEPVTQAAALEAESLTFHGGLTGSKVYLRETAKELIAVQPAADGAPLTVAVFPKP